MLAITKGAKLAGDMRPCTNAPTELLAQFTHETKAMGSTDEEPLHVERGMRADMVNGYRRIGTVGAERTEGVVETCTHKGTATCSSDRWPPPATTWERSRPP